MATDDLNTDGQTKRGKGSGPGHIPKNYMKYYVLGAFILIGLAAAYFA